MHGWWSVCTSLSDMHFTVCSEKDAFEEGEQEIPVSGPVHAQCEPRR